jgi:biotin carboxyl carrier protein
MAQKWLVAILVLTFAFVLMPFLLWYMTTFTRPLNDADLAAYFQDAAHPRRAQHALSQIADRIMSPNPGIRQSAKIWYPEVIKFSEQGSDELRVTSAWVMGQDNQSPEFHAALQKQLADANPMVQRNAALSLVRFADPAGHALIAGMLMPYTVAAQRTGVLSIRLKPGDVINPGTLLAHIAIGDDKTEVRSDVPGTIRQWIPPENAEVKTGEPLLLVDPSPEMVWESLRALYLIGQKDDMPAVNPYVRGAEGMPPQVQQQAALTAREISARGVRE